MSKRALKQYLSDLDEQQLQEQILDLYTRFKEVKTFYNFVFQPKEEKLLEAAKIKISKEYFPTNSRRPKARRSVAQKIIKHWLQLCVDSAVVSELMLFNIEIAQQFAKEKGNMPESFCKSIYNSYNEAIAYIINEKLHKDFADRLQSISSASAEQNWINQSAFQSKLVLLETEAE